jgi:hypothetical protein
VTVHVFPVPRGMDAEDAWAELETFGRFPEYRWWKLRYAFPRWAVIEVDDD